MTLLRLTFLLGSVYYHHFKQGESRAFGKYPQVHTHTPLTYYVHPCYLWFLPKLESLIAYLKLLYGRLKIRYLLQRYVL